MPSHPLQVITSAHDVLAQTLDSEDRKPRLMLHHYRRRSSMPHAGAKPVKSEFIVVRNLCHVRLVRF
jgi:hypothetical protein